MTGAHLAAQLAEIGIGQLASTVPAALAVAACILAACLAVFLGLARLAARRPPGPAGCPWCDDAIDKSLCYCLAPCGRDHCPAATTSRGTE